MHSIYKNYLIDYYKELNEIKAISTYNFYTVSVLLNLFINEIICKGKF